MRQKGAVSTLLLCYDVLVFECARTMGWEAIKQSGKGHLTVSGHVKLKNGLIAAFIALPNDEITCVFHSMWSDHYDTQIVGWKHPSARSKEVHNKIKSGPSARSRAGFTGEITLDPGETVVGPRTVLSKHESGIEKGCLRVTDCGRCKTFLFAGMTFCTTCVAPAIIHVQENGKMIRLQPTNLELGLHGHTTGFGMTETTIVDPLREGDITGSGRVMHKDFEYGPKHFCTKASDGNGIIFSALKKTFNRAVADFLN